MLIKGFKFIIDQGVLLLIIPLRVIFCINIFNFRNNSVLVMPLGTNTSLMKFTLLYKLNERSRLITYLGLVSDSDLKKKCMHFYHIVHISTNFSIIACCLVGHITTCQQSFFFNNFLTHISISNLFTPGNNYLDISTT